jgi:hypothetical protein
MSPNRGPESAQAHNHLNAAAALVLTALLGGCVTTPSATPYPYFERLAIETPPEQTVEETGTVTSTGTLVAAGATAGAAGALATGLLTSLFCGPYFAVCFAGIGAATLGAATVGAAVVGSTGLSAEEAERITAHLQEQRYVQLLGEDLAAAVSERLPAARLAAPGAADARLVFEAQGVRVTPGFEDTVSLQFAVTARLQWQLAQPKPRQTARSFLCPGEPLPLEEWLALDAGDAASGLSRCVDDLAAQILVALEGPGESHVTDLAESVGFGQYDPSTGDW